MQLADLFEADPIQFKDVLTFIEQNYSYSASSFQNGAQFNAENENQGSARVLYFAFINELNEEEALALFGEHYLAVLETPDGVDHQNIRQFMKNGWQGVKFDKDVLQPK